MCAARTLDRFWSIRSLTKVRSRAFCAGMHWMSEEGAVALSGRTPLGEQAICPECRSTIAFARKAELARS